MFNKAKCSVFIRYCPGGPDSDFEYSTQSYTGYEVRSLISVLRLNSQDVMLDT